MAGVDPIDSRRRLNGEVGGRQDAGGGVVVLQLAVPERYRTRGPVANVQNLITLSLLYFESEYLCQHSSKVNISLYHFMT